MYNYKFLDKIYLNCFELAEQCGQEYFNSKLIQYFSPIIFQFETWIIEQCGHGKMRQMRQYKKGCLISNLFKSI